MTSKVLFSTEMKMMPATHGVSEVSPNYFTDAKIKRCAWIALGAVAIAAAISVAGVSIAGIITWPLAFFTIPLCVGAFFAFKAARSIKDYEDPVECAKMRELGKHLNYSQIKKEHHTYENMVKIFSWEILQEKFEQEFLGVDFTTLVKAYPLEEIIRLNLLPLEDLKKRYKEEMKGFYSIHEFKGRFSPFIGNNFQDLYRLKIISLEEKQTLTDFCVKTADFQAEKRKEMEALRHKYPQRQERLLKALDEKKDLERRLFAEKEREATRLGDAATEVAVAVKSSERNQNKSVWEQWRKDQETRAIGQASTRVLVGVGSALARNALDEKLREIEEEKREIVSEGKGREEQLKFDLETKAIEERFQRNRDSLEPAFKEFQKTL